MTSRAVVLALLFAACSEPADPGSQSNSSPEPERPVVVYAVNHPLASFAERIAGDGAEVRFPVPRDMDPAFWTPPAELVAEMQRADVLLLNGAGYAGWVARASLPRSILVDTGAVFRERWIPLPDATTHRHGPEGEHAHSEWASHFWLDPGLARRQAKAVAATLEDARPGRAGEFRERLAVLDAELNAVDERLAAVTARLGDAPVLFSHPVYDYLAQRYAVNGRSLHWEPDEAPPEREWRALETMLREHAARLMLWEAEPLQETRARLEAMGIRAVVFAPCGNVCEDGDALATMRRNAQRLEAALAEPLVLSSPGGAPSGASETGARQSASRS